MKDWSEIKSDYIRTGGSLRSLAKRHGVSFHSVAKACRRENWPLLRRVHADGDRTATRPATRSDNPATGAEPAGLSLPERSAVLKERIVSEMEADVAQVAQTPPQSLQDSEQRQSVIGSVVRSAETVLQWGDKAPTPCVRIAVLAQCSVISSVWTEPPASLPESAPDEITEA